MQNLPFFKGFPIIQLFIGKIFLLHLVCLFGLFRYVPVNSFSAMLGQVFLGWTSTKKG